MRTGPTSDLWWKNAIVYCLDVETYHDADGDGCGDMAGLIERLDHAARLGASCLWLMPFYPTPNRDDGYDVADYLAVDPRLGDLGDVPAVIRHARDRGLRVIVDLVVNHTSDRHPWFRAARADRSSPFRDYYVWSDDPGSEDGTTPDNWTWDEAAGQYYNHSFAPFQPDLNIANPAVRDQIAKIVGFWLALGVSGFRMDAVPFLVQEINPRGVDPGEAKRWLHALREYAMRRSGEAMLMGEANVAMDDIASFFEDHGDALHLQLAFLINQRLWLSLARGDAGPLEELIRRLPVPPGDAGWGTFLRNHDELTLDKLEPDEREEVFAAFAPQEDMRIYGHGIRRRAASMLGGDGPRLRMAWSLLFSLPGTPVVLYGDEIGMVEDLRREGRMSVRTPMQWSDVAEQERDARLAAALRAPPRPPTPGGARAGLGREHPDRERAPGALRPPVGLAGIDGLRRPQPVRRARGRGARPRRGRGGRRRPARAARPPRRGRAPARRARRVRLPVAARLALLELRNDDGAADAGRPACRHARPLDRGRSRSEAAGP